MMSLFGHNPGTGFDLYLDERIIYILNESLFYFHQPEMKCSVPHSPKLHGAHIQVMSGRVVRDAELAIAIWLLYFG